jgi:hypothetical protein
MAIGPDGTGIVNGYQIGPRAKLRGADLTRADLTGADLRGALLDRASLYDANLVRADLSGADLSGADLGGANLRSADLTRARLTGANLQGARLMGADLTGSKLQVANLSGADLRRSDLTGADLTGADLTGAKVEAYHVPLIEEAARKMIASLDVDRTPNPSTTKESGTYLVNGVGTVAQYALPNRPPSLSACSRARTVAAGGSPQEHCCTWWPCALLRATWRRSSGSQR